MFTLFLLFSFLPFSSHPSTLSVRAPLPWISNPFENYTGPTAIISLLIQHYVAENIEFAVFIAFVNGALIFLFGLLNLGFLVQFISTPVIESSSLLISIVFYFWV